MLRSSIPTRVDLTAYDDVTDTALDDLPYGIIVVDTRGTIVAFNRAEARASGYPRERAMGRNFFTDVAPCTHVKAFHGRFAAFVAEAKTSVEPFEFTFPFARGAQRVRILFVRDPALPDRISIIVRRETDLG